MKRLIVPVLALASSIAFGQQQPPSSSAPAQSQQATPKQAQQSAPNPAEFDKQMAQVQENVKKMQEQMNQLQRTQDPQERQRLLQQHWTTMQNAMTTMDGMWGGRHDGVLRQWSSNKWWDGRPYDEWANDGRNDGLGECQRLLFQPLTRAVKAASVHD